LVINTALFTALTAGGVPYMCSALIAMELSSAWNFFLYDRYLFSGSRQGRLARAASFFVTANATFAAGTPLLMVFRQAVGLRPVVANLASITSTMAIRFLVADNLIWSSRPAASKVAPPIAIDTSI
jgi:putative flippase GtrA